MRTHIATPKYSDLKIPSSDDLKIKFLKIPFSKNCFLFGKDKNIPEAFSFSCLIIKFLENWEAKIDQVKYMIFFYNIIISPHTKQTWDWSQVMMSYQSLRLLDNEDEWKTEKVNWSYLKILHKYQPL